MNHFLKKPSPGGLVGHVLNGAKQTNEKHCYYRNRLRSQAVSRNNVQFRCLSYISALKLQLEKNGISKNEKVKQKGRRTTTDSKKLIEMLRVMPPKESTKRIMNIKKCLSNHSKTDDSKIGCIVDSTKSYDPNLLNFKPEEFSQFFTKNNMKPKSLNSNEFGSLTSHNMIYKEFDKCSPCSSNFEYNQNPEQDILGHNSQAHVENLKIIGPLKHQTEFKVTQLGPFKEEDIDVFQEPIWPSLKYTKKIVTDYTHIKILHSSIDICITNGMVKEAYQLFQTFRKRNEWKRAVKQDSEIIQEVYNSVLFALSTKGYWCAVETVIKLMGADNVKLNSTSFGAILNCLATIRKSMSNEFMQQEVSRVLNLIFQNNIPINDVFCKTKLRNEELEGIIAIIRTVIPSFEIEPNVVELSSNCLLVKNLHNGSANLQPQLQGIGIEEMEYLALQQLETEKNFYLNIKAVSRGRRGEVSPHHKETLHNLKKEWRKSLTEAVNRLKKYEMQKFSRAQAAISLHIYLKSVPVEKLVDILMEATQNLVEFSGGYSPTASQFRRLISRKVFQCYSLRKKDAYGVTDKVQELFKKYLSWYCNPSGPARNSRQKWQMVTQDSDRCNQLEFEIVNWPDEVKDELGASLLDIILKEIKFSVKTNTGVITSPVLFTILRHRDKLIREEIKCHPMVAEVFQNVGFDDLYFASEEVPMVCPPKPWRAPYDGGYLFLNTDFIRKKDGLVGKVLKINDIPVQEFYATFDSLNALQSVPWKINEDVLDVVLEVFTNGGSEELGVPLFPERPPPGERWMNLSLEEFLEKQKQKREHIKKLRNNYSLWCEALYRLSLANHFRNKVFWLPQNCDFRGRVYPVPPLVNHLGSDLFRSLLVFAKGKPLGPKGLDWLKIHLINLTGTHKRKSIKERLAYANEILPVILDSAENPVKGDKWWVESDEPWQTLACCMELKKALAVPDPETYICSFPIHQDGSCNGLQHYAALGKDLIGAKSVNLTSSDKPQDVYNVVAELIEQERCMDASNGLVIAKILDGFIERKVVKQTIMTTVYGVTPYGAKLQISKRLEEFPNFPKEHIPRAAVYLQEKTFLSLKKMFTSARQIQDWFLNCATEICQGGDYVQWLTPLGLPVVQSYAKHKYNAVAKMRLIPDMMKQKNAFPPNFVHSLDSSHMMLTSLYCEQAGITFAAIHDCFWTHPNTVDIMNRICREEFVALHSQSILENLSQFFKKTYTSNRMSDNATKVFESVPEKGDFDLREVLNSVYFFS